MEDLPPEKLNEIVNDSVDFMLCNALGMKTDMYSLKHMQVALTSYSYPKTLFKEFKQAQTSFNILIDR